MGDDNMVSKDIKVNKEKILTCFHYTSDLITYEFESNYGIKMLICYIEGFIDRKILNDDILKPLVLGLKDREKIRQLIFSPKIEEEILFENIVDELSHGKLAIFVDGEEKAYLVEISSWEKRSIEQPGAEAVVRGPKEGFIEDIAVNKVLLRRIIRSNNLVFENYKLGQQSKKAVSIAYVKGVVNEDVLEEVRRRLSKINIDAILESGNIEELIEDKPMGLFSTISNAEKPDVVAAKILEGRVAIFTDGTPHVLIVPKLFIEGLQTSEDYYIRPHYASVLRFLRTLSLFISIFLPGIFIALQLYHQEMIPTTLLISAAGAREGVPLPAVLEVFIMIIALELTKESGLRLPKSIGMTVSIVGALILGQAAVQAGIVSGLTVIVVSIAAIAEFTIPDLANALVIARIVIIVLAGFAGIYGITIGFIIMAVHTLSLESFGVAYGWPIAPRDWEGLRKDTFTRAPIWKMVFRPKVLQNYNCRRQVPPRKK